ncbi:uncharacterized protein LOC117176773 isoform X2 [Belonocnema kinseyi]|uniref:uncharacterized protein LOC117176773 isoform X2 n=1 Tax=Belonocnema kinseyi TaxID=2817044 RepID=UPI00143D187A|nr:uncharacterized protein LOC117176773 isoform X2 [Belonocnema kinseyi]
MQLLVLLNVILNVLCVAGKGWNSDDYIEHFTDGYISQWISYLKRFSLAVFIFSGVILYYIPETRSHARKGCCFLIDNIAEGLKTILCLKESEINLGRKKSHFADSVILERQSKNLYKNENVNFENVRHRKEVEEFRQKEDRKEKSKRIREKLKSKINGKFTNYTKHHHRNEKHKSMKDVRESNRHNQEFITPLSFDHVETGNEYFIDDGSTDLSPIYSTRNCTSYFISGSPQQMAMLDEKDNFKIDVPLKLYPVKPKYDKRKINFDTELQKGTCSVAKIMSTAETVILNHPGLKSTCEVGPVEKVKQIQLIKDSESKEAKVYYERTPRLKEKMNAEFRYKEKSGNVNETEKFLQAEENDENYYKSTGTVLLSELGDQINKLDLTVRKVHPPSKKEMMEKDGREEYALQAVEAVLKDIKRGFQEYDEGVKRRKLRTSGTILSEENIEHDNKIKPREAVQTRSSDDENDKFIDQPPIKFNDRKVKLSGKSNYTKKEWKKEKGKKISSKDNRDEDISEIDDISDEEIPLLRNRYKPLLSRAVDWLFGRCPHAERITPCVPENHWDD